MKSMYLRKMDKRSLQKIRLRLLGKNNDVSKIVKKIIRDVKERDDLAIVEKYKKRFDTTSFSLTVTEEEIVGAYQSVSQEFLDALKQAIKNITLVCKTQKMTLQDKPVETDKGILVWTTWRPIEKVGLYIPGGKAIYPSSVLMTAIPALVAGCKEIVLCSPPDRTGKIPAPTLVAADILGLKKVFKVGGAEAIAAMAYGTKNIPAVYKIYGAGNSYVTEAKMQTFGKTAIDMPAGPSEVLVIADDTANPSFIAADLLADGEHGEDSACVLITTSKEIADGVCREIEAQLVSLKTKERIKKSLKRYGLIAVVDTLDEAIDFINDYAPEHLEIMTRNQAAVVKKIVNAGSVFMGPWTTKSSGDYATGANHVLPTAGFAKMFAPLSVESFGKKMQVQKVSSKKALSRIRKAVEVFGETENLPAHKNSVSIRFKKEVNEYDT